jgi:hypothetical protein
MAEGITKVGSDPRNPARIDQPIGLGTLRSSLFWLGISLSKPTHPKHL